MILAKDIEILYNLSQLSYEGVFFDFHNDYDCTAIIIRDFVCLEFKSAGKDDTIVKYKFLNAIIISMDMPLINNGVIDNIYRGRAEVNGELLEFTESGHGYFYVEFDDGQKLEFWATSIEID